MTLKGFYKNFALWGGILYAVSVALYLLFHDYSNMWILYIGNMVFGACVYVGVIRANHRMHDAGSIKSLFMTGIKLTFFALVVAIVLTAVVAGMQGLMGNFAAPDSPSQMGSDTQTDVLLTLISHTTAGNAFMGVLATVLTTATVKRNQKTAQGKTMY